MTARPALIAMLLATLLASCAGNVPEAKVDDSTLTAEMKADQPPYFLPQNREAQWEPVRHGRPGPSNMVVKQSPTVRPCWTFPGQDTCLTAKPGQIFLTGVSTGQDSIESALAQARLDAAGKWIDELVRSREAAAQTESANSQRAFVESRVYSALLPRDRTAPYVKETFWQQWEERSEGRIRVYFKAYVLLDLPSYLYEQP